MKRVEKDVILKLVFLALLFSGMGLMSCSGSLKNLAESKHASYQLGYQSGSPLATYFERLRRDSNQTTLTGFHSLGSGDDALLARIALIESATHTLDLQYYIFGDDETSQIVTWRLYEAAQRGVRVRLLLDDMQRRDDAVMARLSTHPNIEIRLFNPHLIRISRPLSFLHSVSRLNHRMHNKSITADGVAAIVGGRNIGNEYFSFANQVEFGDFDLLLFGPVVTQTASQFDLYWNSEHTVPVSALVSLSDKERKAPLSTLFDTDALAAPFKSGDYDITRLALFEHLKQGTLALHWGNATLWFDLPEKVNTRQSALTEKLVNHLVKANDSIVLVSPYFVPTKAGTQALIDAAGRGVDITIVTNSLASNDVFAVHGWYAKYRKALLESGITLWEMKASAELKRQWSLIGSKRASLHAKFIAVDNANVIVGSMNWDPRSANLNTEMAVVIEAPEYTRLAVDRLHSALPRGAFKVELQNGELAWRDPATGSVYDSEPEASIWKRMGAWLAGILPIEGLL